MEIEIFVICESANHTAQGRGINLLAASEVIWINTDLGSKALSSWTTALRIRFSRIEEGIHTIRLELLDYDGVKAVPPFEDSFEVEFTEEPRPLEKSVNLIVKYDDHGLEPGEYALQLAINGRLERALPLFVMDPDKAGGREFLHRLYTQWHYQIVSNSDEQ